MSDSTTPHETSESGHDEAHDHGIGHVVPFRVLIGTGLALLVLTWLTVLAVRVDLGDANIWIALGIAGIKSAFVALIFMHLWWDRPFNGFVFVTALAFIVLFLSFALTDTIEYQRDVITGDAPKVQQMLQDSP
jgi:cytochrome c oxidase subunit 4